MSEDLRTPEQSPLKLEPPRIPVKGKQKRRGEKSFVEVTMPRRIEEVILDIYAHPNFQFLDAISKTQVKTCSHPLFERSSSEKRDDNKYLRKMWEYFYHGKKLPLG